MARCLFIPLLLSAASAAPLPLVPMPQQVTLSTGALKIDSNFQVTTTAYSDARLQSAIKRFTTRLANQTGIPDQSRDRQGAVLLIECQQAGPTYPTLSEDESYILDISPATARLTARTTTGTLRGFETFLQLVRPGPDGFEVPALHIEDRPRFPWRGLMLDVARHWMPVAVIERNLDAMAAVKLNVFHWHLSDDQGFRVESKRYPKLQQEGSDGNFYAQAEVREVLAYARDRGIRVVPEFDMPGHTTSWFAGYPELASAAGAYKIERRWGVFEPTMDPTREETYTFLDNFIGEMAALFPDPYFHIGGDEVVDKQWKQSASIQAFARAHKLAGSRDLQAYFNQRVEKLLKKRGKTMIGWDEVLSPGLPPETVIQSWRGPTSLADAAAKGYRSLLSYGFYLDHLKPASDHYANDPAPPNLPTREAALILGGEACMWTEYANAETVDSRIWPRMAAIAERLWSPAAVKDTDSMYERLDIVSRWLALTGIQHRASQILLDRLTGNQPAEPLRILAQVSEALGIDGRRTARRYTSLVPLNRFVDAISPESELVRDLIRAAANVLSRDQGERSFNPDLRLSLTQWASVEPRLRPLARNNPLLTELLPLAANLSTAAGIGLRALDFLERRQTPPAGWIEQQIQELDRLEKPVAEVRLAAIRLVRFLLAQLRQQAKPQPLANSNVRSRYKPLCNGPRTVPNWTPRRAPAHALLRNSFVAKGSLYENEG
ncbi:MAG: family 20 glycosylhydrolase [Acidobacteriia bacterium]|nr:family 20 glycosylhydrolase [Terriglobia bacterium]